MVASVQAHLGALVDGYPDRHVGGAGNESATRYVEDVLRRLGWRVVATPFEALDWEHGPARLAVEGREFVVHPGPYTPPLDAEAPLAAVDTLAALEQADITDRIVLLYGDIAARPALPQVLRLRRRPRAPSHLCAPRGEASAGGHQRHGPRLGDGRSASTRTRSSRMATSTSPMPTPPMPPGQPCSPMSGSWPT